MAITPKQVQLRGGTSDEHKTFIGAPREVTIDTSWWSLRVHDGFTEGGHLICRKDEMLEEIGGVNHRIDDLLNDLSGSHNHDDRYAKLIHNHDSVYATRTHNHEDKYISFKTINTYAGFSVNGYDGGWVRTTTSGLLPYQSGGYSSIGASEWAFSEGHFNTLNARTINVRKNGNYSRINFSAETNDPGYIEHYENNNVSHLRLVVSDDANSNDSIEFGVTPGGVYRGNAIIRGDGTSWFRGDIEIGAQFITINGIRLYLGTRPSSAPNGSISIG